ncbi:MAG: hypothetical protein ABI778_04060 [Ignavibacteriota bacterium]
MSIANNAHSDLIHLFIDGEATETERNALFGALKDSPELQEEFASAMQLKQAFASDIMKLQPPSYLQERIAERAGLIVAASSTVATAPVVVNSLSNSVTSALSTAAPYAATGISKGLLTLLIGTTVGVLSTIGVIKYTNSTKETPNAEMIGRQSAIVDRHSSITDRQNSETSQASNINEGAENISGATNNQSSVSGNSLRASTNNSSTQTNRFAPTNQITESPARRVNRAVAESENNLATTVDNNSAEDIETVNNNVSNGTTVHDDIALAASMPTIGLATPMIPEVKNIGGSSAGHTPLYDGNEGFFSEPEWMAHMSVILRGMPAPTSKVFQGGKDQAAVPPWNNVGWGLKYEIDPFSAVALEGGLETFPVYLLGKDGKFTGHHSIGWGGASFTYSFPFAEILAIHPEVRALAGMSSAGPITKFSAGLVFQPVGQFSVSVDPEYTALFIKENGAITAGSKFGLTGSIRFHF